jgi:hypothetical protein
MIITNPKNVKLTIAEKPKDAPNVLKNISVKERKVQR